MAMTSMRLLHVRGGRSLRHVGRPASTQNFGYRTEARRSEVTVTNPPVEATMTRASLREYAAVQRERSQQASRADKHRLLDEMVAVTGMHPLDRQPGDCWVSHVR